MKEALTEFFILSMYILSLTLTLSREKPATCGMTKDKNTLTCTEGTPLSPSGIHTRIMWK